MRFLLERVRTFFCVPEKKKRKEKKKKRKKEKKEEKKEKKGVS